MCSIFTAIGLLSLILGVTLIVVANPGAAKEQDNGLLVDLDGLRDIGTSASTGDQQLRIAVSVNDGKRDATSDNNGGGLPFDLTTMLNMGLPIGSTIKYALPNTYEGFDRDLGQSYQMLSNGASNQMKNLQSGYNSMENNLSGQYNKQYNNGEDTIRRLYEMLSDPQRMCAQLAQQTQSNAASIGNGLQNQAGQGMKSFGQTADSYGSSVMQMQPLTHATQAAGSFLKNFGFGRRK